jgi:hypothetical protein
MFVFDVKMEGYNLLALPPPISKSNDKKDIGLLNTKENLL